MLYLRTHLPNIVGNLDVSLQFPQESSFKQILQKCGKKTIVNLDGMQNILNWRFKTFNSRKYLGLVRCGIY